MSASVPPVEQVAFNILAGAGIRQAEAIRAMQEGKRQARALRDRESILRVREYRAWLKAGCPLGQLACVPSDHDFAVWREAEG